MANTVLAKNFDPERVVFSNKTTDMNEGKTVTSCKISYDYPGQSRFIMQSAKMRAPFGATSGERFQNPDKWTIQLSFQGEDKKPNIARFRKALESLDDRIIQEGIKREKEIAGQKFNYDEDDDQYRQKQVKKSYKSRIRKAPAGSDYSDTFQITIPWDRENKRPRDYVKFYNQDNEEISWDVAKMAGTEVVCLFEVQNVWTSSIGTGSFGPSIKLVQMKVCSTPNNISGFNIQQDEEEDDDVEEEDSVDVEHEEIDDVSD